MNFFLSFSYCKFENFHEDFVFVKLRICAYAKFCENKTLAKWQNHTHITNVSFNAIPENNILAKISESTVYHLFLAELKNHFIKTVLLSTHKTCFDFSFL